MQVEAVKVAEIGVRARDGRNCRLIDVKLDAHDKICQQVVERRIETPQVTRGTGDEAPSPVWRPHKGLISDFFESFGIVWL
jgi:hypothetical protein